MHTQSNFIAGRWVGAAGSLAVINPSDGQVTRISRGGAAEIDTAVVAGQDALDGDGGSLDATARGRLLLRLSDLIKRDAEALAQMESEDVGKPLTMRRASPRARSTS